LILIIFGGIVLSKHAQYNILHELVLVLSLGIELKFIKDKGNGKQKNGVKYFGKIRDLE